MLSEFFDNFRLTGGAQCSISTTSVRGEGGIPPILSDRDEHPQFPGDARSRINLPTASYRDIWHLLPRRESNYYVQALPAGFDVGIYATPTGANELFPDAMNDADRQRAMPWIPRDVLVTGIREMRRASGFDGMLACGRLHTQGPCFFAPHTMHYYRGGVYAGSNISKNKNPDMAGSGCGADWIPIHPETCPDLDQEALELCGVRRHNRNGERWECVYDTVLFSPDDCEAEQLPRFAVRLNISEKR